MNKRPSENNGKGGFNPLTIPKEAIRVVPEMKYALGVLGMVTPVGMVTLRPARY